MRISKKYNRLEKVTYQLDHGEVLAALVEYIKTSTTVRNDGKWEIDPNSGYEYDDDDQCKDFTIIVTHKFTEEMDSPEEGDNNVPL